MPKDLPPTPPLAAGSALTREVLRLRRSLQQLREQNQELLEHQNLLEEARDDYAELYDSAPHPLLTLGIPGTIRSANLAAAELLARERSSLVGLAFLNLFGAHDRPRLSACLRPGLGLNECRVHLVLPNEASALVHVSRRFSVRRPGVLHVTLVDSRLAFALEGQGPALSRTHPSRLILLIEDDLDTAEAIQVALERQGYRVVYADSVQAAVRVDLSHVDAILSDISLPDGKGTDLLRRLKLAREVPAIAFSGLARSSDIELARQAGFDAYLTKPVDFPKLMSALGGMLKRTAPEPEPASA